MKKSVVQALAGLSIGAVVATSLALGGVAEGGPPSGSAAPRSSSPKTAEEPPQASPLVEADIPKTESPAPEEADWMSAPAIALNRGAWASGCSGKRVREWVRITCAGSPGVGLVAGDPKLVKLHANVDETPPLKMVSSADIAVRAGASVVVTFVGARSGLSSISAVEGPTFQMGWREGAGPLLIGYAPRAVSTE